MRRNSLFIFGLLLFFSVTMTSCSAGWWEKSKNILLLGWTFGLPLFVSLLSALTYYLFLQKDFTIRPLSSNAGWIVWWLITVLLSILSFMLIGARFALRNPKLSDWFQRYPEVMLFGMLASFSFFALFSLRFWFWRRRSAARMYPTFGEAVNLRN